jgi:hypothetical protein
MSKKLSQGKTDLHCRVMPEGFRETQKWMLNLKNDKVPQQIRMEWQGLYVLCIWKQGQMQDVVLLLSQWLVQVILEHLRHELSNWHCRLPK